MAELSFNREVHYLDNYYSESPLDGRIVMKIQLNMPPKVTHCGMLRLKDSSGMFGTTDFIKSFFAAIEGSRLNLWNDMREAEEEQVSFPTMAVLGNRTLALIITTTFFLPYSF